MTYSVFHSQQEHLAPEQLLRLGRVARLAGFEITFTGIAEIIVAIGFAIGAIWRLVRQR